MPTLCCMRNESVISATHVVGGQTKLAVVLGVRGPTVAQWISGVRRVPAERCPDIERATEGRVRCEDLRPDIDWAVLRNSGCKEAA